MTTPRNLDSLALNTMASGHLCLNLTERMNWEEFPDFAEPFIVSLGGEIVQKSDGPDLRIWEIAMGGQTLRLVFDDFPVMVSLESSTDEGDALLRKAYGRLAESSRQ